jgi:branched-chain amino acid transport system ATP-binding protein
MLKVENISTGYGKKQVLFDVSFEVKKGEIVLLIGSNGSGKSTLLKAIFGLLPLFDKNNGRLIFEEENITNAKPHQLIQKGLVYVPQKNNTFDHLTVKENLEVAAINLRNKLISRQRISEVFDILPQLYVLQSRNPFNLSGGERQQLALGMALMQKPKMILLDEPGAGLAPVIWQKNLEIIKSLNKSGTTFLIVEHKLRENYFIAKRIISLKLGKIFSLKEVNFDFDIQELSSVFT